MPKAIQAGHAAAAREMAPAQALPAGLTQQQLIDLRNQALRNIHNSMRRHADQLRAIATNKIRGESLTEEEEKLLAYSMQVQKAEKFLTEANATSDPAVKTELQNQYYQTIGPMLVGQIRMMLQARAMQLQSQAAQTAQDLAPGQA